MTQPVITETWQHRPRVVSGIFEFRGFGPTGNGENVVRRLREEFNVEAYRLGDLIEIDTGNDDGKIRATAGDRFVPGVDGNVYRVKSHMWDLLWQRPTGGAS